KTLNGRKKIARRRNTKCPGRAAKTLADREITKTYPEVVGGGRANRPGPTNNSVLQRIIEVRNAVRIQDERCDGRIPHGLLRIAPKNAVLFRGSPVNLSVALIRIV